MVLASSYSYPLLGAFWTIFIIFLWVIWFWILITVFIDLFRSHDLSGWAKALWFIFILILPLIGVLAYVVVHGDRIQDRREREILARDAAFRAGGTVARSNSPSSPTCTAAA